MKETNTPAAFALAVGMVISSWVFYFAMTSLGESIEKAAVGGKPHPISIPDRIHLEIKPVAPTVLRVESSSGGPPLKIEMSERGQ